MARVGRGDLGAELGLGVEDLADEEHDVDGGGADVHQVLRQHGDDQPCEGAGPGDGGFFGGGCVGGVTTKAAAGDGTAIPEARRG